MSLKNEYQNMTCGKQKDESVRKPVVSVGGWSCPGCSTHWETVVL